MSHKLLFLQIDSKIEDLMNMLECPVCLDTADRPPIYQCTEGHLLCESCNHRLSACPQCGHSLLNSRNRTAEGLAVKLQVSPLQFLSTSRVVNYKFSEARGCQYCLQRSFCQREFLCQDWDSNPWPSGSSPSAPRTFFSLWLLSISLPGAIFPHVGSHRTMENL